MKSGNGVEEWGDDRIEMRMEISIFLLLSLFLATEFLDGLKWQTSERGLIEGHLYSSQHTNGINEERTEMLITWTYKYDTAHCTVDELPPLSNWSNIIYNTSTRNIQRITIWTTIKWNVNDTYFKVEEEQWDNSSLYSSIPFQFSYKSFVLWNVPSSDYLLDSWLILSLQVASEFLLDYIPSFQISPLSHQLRRRAPEKRRRSIEIDIEKYNNEWMVEK